MRLSTFSLILLAAGVVAAPTPVAPDLLAGLHWRNLGPFRAGRIAAVSGAIGQAGTFYIGLPLGGVWKTTSAGETWTPVFDAVTEASSVGALEVAPSDPNVIYVGMGDLITGGGINEGNGVYKSTDAGKTWQHLGLDETRQIPAILVDPRDPNLVLIAAMAAQGVSRREIARRLKCDIRSVEQREEKLDPTFYVDFGPDFGAHQIRLQGGDCSTDSFCYPSA